MREDTPGQPDGTQPADPIVKNNDADRFDLWNLRVVKLKPGVHILVTDLL
jgi:hypothetical protein